MFMAFHLFSHVTR